MSFEIGKKCAKVILIDFFSETYWNSDTHLEWLDIKSSFTMKYENDFDFTMLIHQRIKRDKSIIIFENVERPHIIDGLLL